jgi:hypothetical protein
MKYDDLVRSILQEQKNTILYKEGILSTAGHAMLSLAGFIPGVGEFFDLANTLLYLKEREYLNAALSLVSCIPVIGDIIGKGTMVANFLSKLSRYLKTTGTVGRGAVRGITNVRRGVVRASPVIQNLKNKLKERQTQFYIKALFARAEKDERLKPYVGKMKEALNVFLST